MDVVNQVILSLLTVLVSGAFSLILVGRQARAELLREYESRLNTKKWDLYIVFTEIARKIIVGAKAPSLENEVTAIANQIILIGSDDVVKAFRMWRVESSINDWGNENVRNVLFDLIIKMRKDLGVKYNKLDIEDILRSIAPSHS